MTVWELAIFVILIAALIIVGVRVLKWLFSSKSKWGVNTARVECFKCGATAPIVRKPANLKQFLWGGWTCTNCGSEMDKWGKEV